MRKILYVHLSVKNRFWMNESGLWKISDRLSYLNATRTKTIHKIWKMGNTG